MKRLLFLLIFLPLTASALSDWQQTEAESAVHKVRQSAEKKTFKQVKGEVKAGFTDSIVDLADLYYEGIGTKKNYKKAYRYYQKAARQGNAYAAYSQAFMLMYGEGVKKTPPKAFHMFSELADNGFELAALEMYRAYQNGNGCEKDAAQARQWLEKAANYRVPTGLLYLGMEVAEEDPVRGFFLLKEAADLEDKRAQYLTALCYQEGKGAPANARRAFEYMLLSAKQHYGPAQWQTAQWYAQGYGTRKSVYQEFRWTRLAALEQVPQAQERLAQMYEEGIGTPIDKKLAKKWYKEAKKNKKEEEAETWN